MFWGHPLAAYGKFTYLTLKVLTRRRAIGGCLAFYPVILAITKCVTCAKQTFSNHLA